MRLSLPVQANRKFTTSIKYLLADITTKPTKIQLKSIA